MSLSQSVTETPQVDPKVISSQPSGVSDQSRTRHDQALGILAKYSAHNEYLNWCRGTKEASADSVKAAADVQTDSWGGSGTW